MTLIMGVVNVTDDSFSDGGMFSDVDAAVRQGSLLASQGASIVDVGGESTRPGARRISEAEEQDRVIPVISALSAAGLKVSVDTMRSSTAALAVREGARIINDVSGGRADPDMLSVIAEEKVECVLMHWRTHSLTMQQETHYDDVVTDVINELDDRRQAALAAGIPGDKIILDPGIGFSKSWDQNWELLGNLDRFQDMGHRLLVGVSRKRFLGELLQGRPPIGRDAATAAISTWCALEGIWGVRTHEVPTQLDAIKVGVRLRQARGAPKAPVG